MADETTLEGRLIEFLIDFYEVEEEIAQQLAQVVLGTPGIENLSDEIFDDVVWTLVNWGSITKPPELRGATAQQVLPWLVTPQGFTWARARASEGAPLSTRQKLLQEQFARTAPTGQEAFMQSEVRRLGLGVGPERERQRELDRLAGEQVNLQQIEAVRQRGRSQQEQLEREQFANLVGEFPSQQPLVSGAIAGIPVPAARRFFSRELPGIIQGAGIPALRRAWWERRARFPGVSPRGAGDISVTGTEAEIAEAEEPLIEFERARERQLAEPDPLKTLLGGFNFLERFQAATPRERGFQSRQFRPRTRFINF